MPADRTILLTGSTGFVGRQILRWLISEGYRVRAVVRSGRTPPLAPADSVEYVESADLFSAKPAEVAELCRDVDTVVHAAWYAEPGVYLQSPLNLTCLEGTLRLARTFLEMGGRRFVGVGTCFEYDLSHGYLKLDTPLRPVTPYAAAKAAAYLALDGFFRQQKREFAWCRLFYLHGEGEDERRLVPKLRARLAAGQPVPLTSGNEVRDYMDVAVAGSLIARVAVGRRCGPVNICSGTPVTLRQIAEGIAAEYGAFRLLRWGEYPPDTPFIVGEPTPIEEDAVRVSAPPVIGERT